MAKPIDQEEYQSFLSDIKETIQQKQLEAFRRVNQTILELYWELGEKIALRQKKYDWGRAVVEKLSRDLQKGFPGIRGFSVQNLWYMRTFYTAYHQSQRLKALLPEVGWSHHIAILTRVKDDVAREYYLRSAAKFGWTRNVLMHKIEAKDFERFALSCSNNFSKTLPEPVKGRAKLALKDHYLFDFLEMGDDYLERELELELIQHMREFILELGVGEFAFLGSQFKITVDEEEFFIDLLFYHRTLKALIAMDLKVGKFQPEYVGKLNFYLAALDQQVKKEEENPSIGLILCQKKSQTMVEYAFSNLTTPMGVATYSHQKSLPPKYRGLLPSPKDLQREMENWGRKKAAILPRVLPKTFLSKTPEKEPRGSSKEAPPSLSLKARQLRMLKTLRVGDEITSSQYASRANISPATALRDLKDMEKQGVTKRCGQRRNTYFEILRLV